MLSGVTHETRVLCSKLCLAGGIMLKLCWTKMTLPPHPSYPNLSFLKEMLDNNIIIQLNIWWASERSEIVWHWKAYYMCFFNVPAFDKPKTNRIENALGMSLRYQIPKIFPLFINLVHSGASCKICIHFSWFSETTALCCKNISIIPVLHLMLQI